jgi:hypothetical protein
MPTVQVAMSSGPRLNKRDQAIWQAISDHPDYIWSLTVDDLGELRGFAEMVSPEVHKITEKEVQATIHKLHKKGLIGRIRIGTKKSQGRWHYGSHEVCKIVRQELNKQELRDINKEDPHDRTAQANIGRDKGTSGYPTKVHQ